MKMLDLFYSEEFCVRFILDYRLKTGVFCKKCGHNEHIWQERRMRFRCKRCNRETTLRSGTAMEYSKLPLRYWVVALYYLACSKKPCSAAFLQRILQHKYYEPIWAMLHKLRITMGHRTQLYHQEVVQERAIVEFEVAGKKGKPDSSQATRALVLIEMCADNPAESGSFRSTRYYIRMQALKQALQFPTRRKTPKPPLSHERRDSRFKRVIENFGGKMDSDTGPIQHGMRRKNWIRIYIENMRRNIYGIFHHIDEKYLQNYLSEYCYTTNRRFAHVNRMESILNLLVAKPWHQISFPVIKECATEIGRKSSANFPAQGGLRV